MRSFRRFEFLLGAGLLLLIGGAVLFSAWLFPDDGKTTRLAARLIEPFANSAYPLGTDPLGRDVLARTVAGGRISFIVGILSALGSITLGTILGLLAGYYRGFWDTLLMRFADIQLALPFILLAITVITITGPGLWQIILVMIVAQWVQYARLIRSSVLSLRQMEYVQAARSYGLPDRHILFRHKNSFPQHFLHPATGKQPKFRKNSHENR